MDAKFQNTKTVKSLIVSDYTKIKNTKLSFAFCEPENRFVSISAVNNEFDMNDVVNVRG